MGENKKVHLSALDEYINKVYILVLAVILGACMCAGILYTFEKFMGWLPTVSWIALIIFDVTNIFYLLTGIFFIKTGFSEGHVKKSKLREVKIFLLMIVLIQFNFIIYMVSSKDFWSFAFFFVVLMAFFLDYKMIIIASLEVGVSLVVSWVIKPDVLLPLKDEMFMANLLNIIVCVSLSLPTIVLLTYLIKRFLVNAKKDEMERNNEQVKNVLNSVQALSDNLFRAGNVLSQISENESTSVEELSATSEQLLESSNMLGSKTEESMANLSELDEWKNVVADNVEKVEKTSNDLLNKSKENEKMLSDLKSINGEVSDSMVATTDVARKLSEAVEQIGTTISLINEISESTNLLALNASIEAARAGEAGRGFAVVAGEIGSLAENSSETVNQIQALCVDANKSIESIQTCFEDIIAFMEKDVSGRFQEFADMAGQYEAVVNDIQEVIHNIHDKSSAFSESATNIREQINNVKMASNDNEQGVDDIIVKNDMTTQTADSIIRIADLNQSNVEAIKDILDMFK